MDDAFVLILLSMAMFVGSFFIGSLPLVVPFSESRLRLVTVLGAGLLVGTALAVIIPEGVQSIYSAAEKSQVMPASDKDIAQSHQSGNLASQNVDSNDQVVRNNQSVAQQLSEATGHRTRKKDVQAVLHQPQNADAVNAQTGPDGTQGPAKPLVASPEKVARRKRDDGVKVQNNNIGESPTGERDVDFPDHHDDQQSGSHSHDHSHRTDVHGTVGVALVAGFVLMLLVDQLAQQRSGRDVDLGNGVASVQPRYKLTATIGLVVHAAADGVALGAASASAHSEIQLIVFLAIMLHKAPASFGLVTFLLHEGLDKGRIRRHLLIFALAAPVAAVVTYIFISQGGNKEKLTSMNTTGVLLLFSAGTFLYVATVHVLPEVAAGGHHHSGAGGHGRSGFKLNELIALVFGAIAPTFLTLGHSH